MRSYSEVEGVGMLTQLLQQPLLQAAQRRLFLLQRGEGLDRADVQILPEGKAQDVQVLPTITKRTGQSHKHWGRTKTLINDQSVIQPVCYSVSI